MAQGYFVHGAEYLRWTVGGGQVDPGFPRMITEGWANIEGTGFGEGIDTVVDLGHGKAYLFLGDQYVRVDHATNSIDGPVLSIGDQWPGMAAAGFADNLDAAVNYGDGRAYFFRGGEYVRYDIASDLAGDPLPIAGNWPGLAEAGFDSGLDAAVNWGDGAVYFFLGEQYLTYDIATDTANTPALIAAVDGWPGLVEAGFTPVDAAWVRLTETTPPASPGMGAGDHVWYWNGNVSQTKEIPRQIWFPGSTGPHDYLGHGTEIELYLVHADGSILRGQPHLRNARGSFAWLNRNPGNMKLSEIDYGQYPDKATWHDFMIFPTHALGFAAIATLLRGSEYAGLSLLQAFQRYAPVTDGHRPDEYASDTAAAMGVRQSAIVGTLDDVQILVMQLKIQEIERTIPGETLSKDSFLLPNEVRALLR